MTVVDAGAIGAAIERRDARAKVTGSALYAYEYPVEGAAYAALVQSHGARGRIVSVDVSRALELSGVLTAITYENAPRLNRTEAGELFVLQEPRVAYYGQIVAAVVAESLEVARDAAAIVEVEMQTEPHDVTLRLDHPGLHRPEHVVHRVTETAQGDVDEAIAVAAVTVDRLYTTPAAHNLAMEPHSSLALWDDGGLLVYDSNQFAHGVRSALAESFGLELEHVRVINANVGGGFGSKGQARPQLVVAAMAAKLTGRPVKIALTRREMFPISGHRSPTIQRVRLGATGDGTLTAWEHVAYAQTSEVQEFCEPCTTGTRVMYSADNRFNTHRLVQARRPLARLLPSSRRGAGLLRRRVRVRRARGEGRHRSGGASHSQ